MNPWMKWILLATPLALTQCRHGSVAPIGTVTPNDGGEVMLAHGQGEVAYEAPPHTFSPRQHPPRHRADAPPPNLAALPKMVLRMDQCYGRGGGVVAKPTPVAKAPRPRPAQPKKYKQVQYNQGGAEGAIAKGGGGGPPPASPSGAKSSGADGFGTVNGGQPIGGSGAGRGYGGLVADSAPMPEPTATRATAADKRASRQAAKEEKKARRDRVTEEASAPAEAEMSAPDSDMEDSAVAYEPVAPVAVEEQYGDWGQSTYLSNDDTMSLSSAQRVIFAIDKFLPVPLEHIRPHELLNYFSFETAEVAPTDDFSVLPEIAKDPKQDGIYNLALAVRGRPVDKLARRNGNLTFVVDRSGSMSAEGRMTYLIRGMRKMIGELKTGDLVNVVLFDHDVCVPIENFVVGRDKPEALERVITSMKPRGATDVHAGLTRGYALADRGYQPTYTNRVVLITDALTNTGDTDPRTMAMVAKYHDERKIRLSGVGVGAEFNDALLDKLTERGKGAYVFLGSEAEVDAVFGSRFISLIETTATDVHFQLHLPPSLRMNVFYGEESSSVKEDVQAIHYFANTSQLFLSDVMARGNKLRPQDQIMLTVEYEDPESGTKMVEERAFSLAEIEREAYNIRKGRLLIGWADRLAMMASRPAPGGSRPSAGAWEDPDGWQQCEQGKADLRDMSQGMNDPEVTRVLSLWDKFCARYERPRNPVRRTPGSGPDGWPSAR